MRYLFLLIFILIFTSCVKEQRNISANEKVNVENIMAVDIVSQQEIVVNKIDELLSESNLYKENMAAEDYYEAGVHFSNMEMWYEAEIMFYMAMGLDREHVSSIYNLARIFSIRVNNNKPRCSYLEREYFHESSTFALLHTAVQLDQNKAIIARNEPDFDNIRNIDSRLFDAITLPENQRERFEHNLVYIDLSFSPGIGVFDLIFAEIGHETNNERWIRISPWFSPLLSEVNLYYSDEDEDFPRWVRNEEMIGKSFKIIFIDQPFYSENINGNHILRANKVFSIIKLE